MSANNQTHTTTQDSSSFFTRILANDALRKGLAGAIAGVLVATVSEALWPSR